VGQNVVEFAVVRTDVAQVGREEGDVLDPQRGDGAASGGNGFRRQVDSSEAAFGERIGHRDEVAAVSAADLEHAAIRDGGGRHAEERTHRRQAVGMRGEPGHGGVRDLVVGVVGHKPLLWLLAALAKHHVERAYAVARAPLQIQTAVADVDVVLLREPQPARGAVDPSWRPLQL